VAECKESASTRCHSAGVLWHARLRVELTAGAEISSADRSSRDAGVLLQVTQTVVMSYRSVSLHNRMCPVPSTKFSISANWR